MGFPRTGARTVALGEEGTTLNAPASTLTLLPAGTPLPRAVFTRIDVKTGETHAEVRLALPARVPFTVEQQVNPGSSSLDLRLFHAVADVDSTLPNFPGGPVRDVRRIQESDGVARVGLNGATWGYDATYEGTALVLRVRNPPALDARALLRVPEKRLVLPITLRVAQLLRDRGATVVLTRETGVTLPIYDCPLLGEERDADLLVSLHANTLPDGVDPGTRRGAGVSSSQPQAPARSRAPCKPASWTSCPTWATMGSTSRTARRRGPAAGSASSWRRPS